MQKKIKKWWELNLMFVLMLSFILSLLYGFYYNSKVIAESLIRSATMKITQMSVENQRKNNLSPKYYNWDNNIYNNPNFIQWKTKVQGTNKKIYTMGMSIKHTPRKDTFKYISKKNIILNMDLFRIKQDAWCGPAVLQMVINYFTNHIISQETFTADYGTEYLNGTYPEYILKMLHKFASPYYINKKLHQNYGINIDEQKLFYYNIKNSLEHHFPVLLGFQGRYPQMKKMMGHYVIIYGIQVAQSFHNYRYLILDPELGWKTVKQSKMYHFFGLNNGSQMSIYNNQV